MWRGSAGGTLNQCIFKYYGTTTTFETLNSICTIASLTQTAISCNIHCKSHWRGVQGYILVEQCQVSGRFSCSHVILRLLLILGCPGRFPWHRDSGLRGYINTTLCSRLHRGTTELGPRKAVVASFSFFSAQTHEGWQCSPSRSSRNDAIRYFP